VEPPPASLVSRVADIAPLRKKKNKKKKTKKKVTMKIMSNRRDRRKTVTSTFVNFIHQKDAYIAMKFVEKLSNDSPHTPIYTVHDNFITTAKHSHKLPLLYSEIIEMMDHPLKTMNQFIYDNIIYYINTDEALNHEYAHISSDIKQICYDKIHNSMRYYPREMLETFLKVYSRNHFPDKGGKPFLKEWIAKNEDILNRYYKYVETVYPEYKHKNNPNIPSRNECSFKREMLRNRTVFNTTNYCLHH
jgi:hypothetical protein